MKKALSFTCSQITPIHELFKKDPMPKPTKYPGLKQTRSFNRRQAKNDKAELAHSLYIKIKLAKERKSTKRLQELYKHIKSLRPSIKALKDIYRKRGDSEAIVEKLVTPENYPHLPYVWLNKKQQRVLLDVIDGKEHLHQRFIENEFH
jgi:hypothetical protein